MAEPLYDHAGITLFQADCLELLPQLRENFDAIITSPPYNLGNSSPVRGPKLGHYADDARSRGGAGKWDSAVVNHGYESFDDNLPHDEYAEQQTRLLKLCWGLLSERGAIFYNHKPRVLGTEALLPLELSHELPLRQIVVWARPGGMNCTPSSYMSTYEWILIFAKPAWRLRDRAASAVGDVWRMTPRSSEHPAPFPLELPSRIIETTGAKSVLDPYAGSGTTLLAAKNAGIRGLGVELERRYCDIAISRFAQASLPFHGIEP